MTKRRMIALAGLCTVIAAFTTRTLSETDNRDRLERLREMKRVHKMSEAERRRYAAKKRAQAHLEQERKLKKSARTRAKQRSVGAKKLQQLRGWGAKVREELLTEKAALRLNEQQWATIKPKLAWVRELRARARCTVGLIVAGASPSRQYPGRARRPPMPTMQWNVGWKDRPLSQLTDAQKVANKLMGLLDSRSPPAESLQRMMGALRKAMSAPPQLKLEKGLAQAQARLRKALTARQQAALVLLEWVQPASGERNRNTHASTIRASTPAPKRVPQIKGAVTAEEGVKALEQRRALKEGWNKKGMDLMARGAWKSFLPATDPQLDVLEPRIKRIGALKRQIHGAAVGALNKEGVFRWVRPSDVPYGDVEGKVRNQMPQSNRIEERLIDLLQDPNSTDSRIRQELHALYEARESAREDLSKAKRRLATLLTTPRQEAVFLLIGDID